MLSLGLRTTQQFDRDVIPESRETLFEDAFDSNGILDYNFAGRCIHEGDLAKTRKVSQRVLEQSPILSFAGCGRHTLPYERDGPQCLLIRNGSEDAADLDPRAVVILI